VHLAPHATATLTLLGGRLTVAPGLRVELSHFAGYLGTPDSFAHSYLSWEPRLQVRLQPTRGVAIKAALGTYHQPPDPASFLRRLGNPDVTPESATHFVAGVEVRPTQTLTIETSAFYKDLSALIVRAPAGARERLDNGGAGRAYGVELMVRQQLTHHFSGWLAYTLSRAERRDASSGWRPFDYDQTHVLSLVAQYELPWGILLGARFRYVSGTPTTPASAWFWDANGDGYDAVLGATNSARLAPFHQLDLRVEKSFTQRWFRWSVYLDVQNVYNQPNAERVQYAPRPEDGSAPVTGIPIFPSLGVRGEL
jgi:outer membrane receptor protein involved in Fe transport